MIKIGQMIRDIREDKQLKQQVLCRGLCTPAALSKQENGEQIPDSLLFHTMMERMGKNSERFYFAMTEQEADYYEWKEKTQQLILEKQWEQLREELEKQIEEGVIINESIQRQYECYIRAILADKLEQQKDKAVSYIRQAIESTMPEIETVDWNTIRISGDELQLILYYIDLRYRQDRTVLVELLHKINHYITENVDDIFQKAKVCSKFTCLYIKLMGDNITLEESIQKAEAAVEQLVSVSAIYDLPELLRILEDRVRRTRDVKWIRYHKQREALREVMEEYGVPYEFRVEIQYGETLNICLLNERLKLARKQKKYTQEMLSDGICSVENYSRIENGRKKPTVKNYSKLAEKLNLGWGYYGGQLITDDYGMFERLTKVRGYILENKYQLVELMLKELEDGLDMSYVENRQIIDLLAVVTRQIQGKIEEEEFILSLKKILEYTISTNEKMERPYTETELEIIYQIGRILRELKRTNETLEMLDTILSKCENNKCGYWKDILLLKRMYAGFLNDARKCEDSIKKCNEVLKKSIACEYAFLIAETINLVAYNLELLGQENRKTCDNLYVKAFYLADLFDNRMVADHIKEYYEKHYDTIF